MMTQGQDPGPPRLFISYRRRTEPKDALLVFNSLRHHLPVFMDTRSLQPGDVFDRVLDEALGHCETLLALIGPGWLGATLPGAGRRKLDDPADYVRREIRMALERGVRVIPLLLDGAPMPSRADLPADLHALADRQALSLCTTEVPLFEHGIARLLDAVQGSIPVHRPGWAAAVGHDRWGHWADLVVGRVSQRLRLLSPGEFWMGSPADEVGRKQDEVRRVARVETPFWMADTACTQALWQAVTGQQPSRFRGDDLPVEQVSWDAVNARFLTGLNRRVPGLNAMLPSEVQWEYACRAGTDTAYHWGKGPIPPDRAHHGSRLPRQTVPVRSFEPNAWGLYQMHGNVMEWCAPPGQGTRSDDRMVRGGSWNTQASTLRSAYRLERSRTSTRHDLGFRLAVPACRSPILTDSAGVPS